MIKLNTFDDFFQKSGFDGVVKPTLEEFKQKLSLNGKNYYDHLKTKSFEDGDIRQNVDEYFAVVYDFFWKDYKDVLKQWWNDHCAYEEDSLPQFSFHKNIIVDNQTFDGTYKLNSGRIIRNLCYSGIYEKLDKPNTNSVSIIRFFQNFYLRHELTGKNILVNMTTRFMQQHDYSGFFAILRGIAIKNSVFNPYTYSYILRKKLSGSKLLCPVMSWCVPVVALHNTDFDELVGIDVIPETVEISENLHRMYNSDKGPLDDPKNCKIFLCPSEEIESRYSFSKTYTNYFDTVFFSPPYYDLEMYEGGEQSWQKFKTYQEWLDGYWEETVKLCFDSLKEGGKFSFVIVPEYKRLGETVTISSDMLSIAKKYFTFNETCFVEWGGFKKSSGGEKRKNIIEHIHILTKDKK